MIITINGKPCECEKGEYLLQIARRNGIDIPTLCHHDAIGGQSSCRLCIVEVFEKGRGKVVVSCVYPVERECEVFTDNEKIRAQRGMILRLLQSRAPDSPEIAALCDKYKAPEIKRFVKVDGGKCVLCGLCARACAELSVGAISTVNRGVTKEIATPYHEPNYSCVGCGTCARICPTGAITLTEDTKYRYIWGRTFPLMTCKRCGRVMGTKQERDLAFSRSGSSSDLCDDCRKRSVANIFAETLGR